MSIFLRGILLGVVALALLGICSAGAPFAGAEAVPSSAAGVEWVCIDAVSQDFGTFCTYASHGCSSGKSMMRYDVSNLPAGDCGNPAAPSCLQIKTGSDPVIVGEKVAENGIPEPFKANVDPKSGKYSKILGSNLAKIEVVKGKFIYAKLLLVLDQVPKRPAFISGQGVEIKKVDKVDFTIDYDPKVVSNIGQVVRLNFGGADYTVVANTKLPKTAKKEPPQD